MQTKRVTNIESWIRIKSKTKKRNDVVTEREWRCWWNEWNDLRENLPTLTMTPAPVVDITLSINMWTIKTTTIEQIYPRIVIFCFRFLKRKYTLFLQFNPRLCLIMCFFLHFFVQCSVFKLHLYMYGSLCGPFNTYTVTHPHLIPHPTHTHTKHPKLLDQLCVCVCVAWVCVCFRSFSNFYSIHLYSFSWRFFPL